MKFTFSKREPTQLKTPCLIVAVSERGGLSPTAEKIDKSTGGRLSRLLKSGDVCTRPGNCHLWIDPQGIAAPRVLLVGVGKPEKFDASNFVKACVAAARYLSARNIQAAASTLAELPVENRSEQWKVRQAALASDWGAYQYRATVSKQTARKRLAKVCFFGGAELEKPLAEAAAIAAGARRARELGNLPANICNPDYLARQARKIASLYETVTVQVLGGKQMEKLGMGALLGVARGSANAPKLIVLRHAGAAARAKPYVLVGKGITFDTGGISIKPGKGMEEMKFDMCGAAGVMGALEACAILQLPINVVAVVAAAENMPDGRAYRPGDVVTSMSGQTIEVLNTDAEGRLILCDALSYVERFKPQIVIDVATLTGACVVALGKHASGLMSRDDELAEALLKAGGEVHDRAWRLPLWEDYQQQLETPYADMANVGGPGGGAITAGCFLSRFANSYRWAHLDVAGTAWDGGTKNGATGRPVGLLTQFLIDRG